MTAVMTRPTLVYGEYLLALLARNGRRNAVTLAAASLLIAGIAAGRSPRFWVMSWYALALIGIGMRWFVVNHLVRRADVDLRVRVRIAVGLIGFNGFVQALALLFFPSMNDFERAIVTVLFASGCAAAVSATGGYLPAYLTYLLITMLPLSAAWFVVTPVSESHWVEVATGLLGFLFCLMLGLIGRDASRMVSDSFAIRRQQLETNRALQAALDDAEAANGAKSRFLASASHDLRQPMHTLSLFGAALMMRPLDDRSREICVQMNVALQVLVSQLDALLDISKLDAGVVKVSRTVVALHPLLERLLGELEAMARQKRIALALDGTPDVLVDTDPLLFERVVRNLLDNAIKYTDRGVIRTSFVAAGDRIRLSICDSGRGIPESEQHHVFEEFYQVDNPERDRTRGLGLGLAIVRRLTELLDIGLVLRSTPGIGTTVTLDLQVCDHEAPRPTTVVEASDISGARVLVVDDEQMVRAGMQTLLEGLGCRVALASSTDESLATAARDLPDIVLADFRLRGADSGIHAIARLRALYPRLPALLISGDTDPARLREADAAGIDLLHKPLSANVLRQAIARTLHSMRKETA